MACRAVWAHLLGERTTRNSTEQTIAQLKEDMCKRSSEELRSKMKDTNSPHHLTQALQVTWKTTHSSSNHFGWNFWSVVGKETMMVLSLSPSPITLRFSYNFADLLLPTQPRPLPVVAPYHLSASQLPVLPCLLPCRLTKSQELHSGWEAKPVLTTNVQATTQHTRYRSQPPARDCWGRQSVRSPFGVDLDLKGNPAGNSDRANQPGHRLVVGYHRHWLVRSVNILILVKSL